MSKHFSKKKIREMPFKELLRETWGPYRRLLPYVKKYRFQFIAGILAGIGAGASSALFTWVIKLVSGKVFVNGGNAISAFKNMSRRHSAHHAAHAAANAAHAAAHAAHAVQSTGVHIQTIVGTCLLIPAVMCLRSLLTFFDGYLMAWVSLRVLNDLRNDLFEKIIGQSMDFFNTSQSGQLISRIMNDTRVAQMALTQISDDIVVQPCTIVGVLAALLTMDWQFTLLSFTLFPICLIPIIFYGRKVRREGADEEAGTGDLMTVLHEAFTGVRVVKALAREEYEVKDFREAGETQVRMALSVRRAIEIVSPLIEAVSAIGVAMALVYVWVRGITADVFLGLIGGLFLLYDPIKKLSRVHLMIQKALASMTRIFDMMSMEPTILDAPGATKLERVTGSIELDCVTFGYRKGLPPALRDVSLKIVAGKTYALVGASGAGKSTILSMILRFYDPQAGAILIDGHDLRNVTQTSLRQNIAVVNQDTFLFHTTIYENILYGRLDATKAEVYAAAEQAFAHDFICEQPQKYDTIIGDKGCNLSGGQQQRIAIARALLKNAPILLLDEATSALDSESEKKIQIALERLSQGRTVIAIAHRLSTILKADQIVAMDHGRIAEIGTHAELYEKGGHYRRLYDLQFSQLKEEQEAFAVIE